MTRHPRLWWTLVGIASALAGCDYGSNRSDVEVSGTTTNPVGYTITGQSSSSPPADRSQAPVSSGGDSKLNQALIDSIIRLVETAPTAPGGDNFAVAVEDLNQLFHSTPSQNFRLEPEARKYLLPRFGEKGVQELESAKFTKRDGRHLEDCLLYHTIATRVAGTGDELSRVRAIFDWVVQQVQLVPAGSLALPGIPQAEARPYDVLMRGMATEQGGSWAERAWLFLSLCRQIGIDGGLVVYAPRGGKPDELVTWVCAMLIGDQAYLFDTRIGLPIPGPDGAGVATLEQAATIPLVLERLDLPGQSPYRTTQADLAAGKITILIDSSQGYLASRMRLLQESLTAKYRMILYRDPSAMRDHFAQVLGPRLANVELWALPKSVEDRLFVDSKFVTATLYPLMFFEPKWPLLSARLDQLRGEIDSAKEKIVKFRKNPKAMEADGKKPIPAEVRRALDMYATYYLGLCHLDQDRPDLAADMFRQTLELFPEPRLGEPYYHMFRWGAQANLGRLCEAKGDDRGAIGYYSEPDPTSQFHGNLYRARDLVWRDPTAPVPEPLPPPPPSSPVLQQAAAK